MLSHLEYLLEAKGHAIVCLAEGAGQEYVTTVRDTVFLSRPPAVTCCCAIRRRHPFSLGDSTVLLSPCVLSMRCGICG